MSKTNIITQEQKMQSLRQALLQTGYDMAASQAESMAEDDEVFDLLYEGAANYMNETYGEDWKDRFPEPQYNK